VGLEQTSGSFLKRLPIAPTLLETAKKKEVFDDTGTTQTKASANTLLRVFLGLSISSFL
jgi:hypothetical protein